MASHNRVSLIGNLTRDPQVRQLPSNTVIADFGMATHRKYKNQLGEEKEETCFVDCTAFGKQAELIGLYCEKGKQLFVEGRLKYDTWDDKTGGRRSKLSVIVENFQFLSRGQDAKDGEPAARRSGGNPQQRLFRGQQQDERKSPEQPFGDEVAFKEADIPF